MAKRKRQADPAVPAKTKLTELAVYNAERARGIVHTPEWDMRMAVLQQRFDKETAQEAQWEAEAYAARRRQQAGLR